MRISDWSSDVCSSDLIHDILRRKLRWPWRSLLRRFLNLNATPFSEHLKIGQLGGYLAEAFQQPISAAACHGSQVVVKFSNDAPYMLAHIKLGCRRQTGGALVGIDAVIVIPHGGVTTEAIAGGIILHVLDQLRMCLGSEEHTSELHSLMRI